MTNCKDCEYFELISTGVLDEPYILICNCLDEPPIYLGYEYSKDDIGDEYEICDLFWDKNEMICPHEC